jgi:hypothetical protein
MSSAPDLGSTARVSRQDEQLVIRRLNAYDEEHQLGPVSNLVPERLHAEAKGLDPAKSGWATRNTHSEAEP